MLNLLDGCAVVHCRTGSLEVFPLFRLFAVDVHCRTGSLESNIDVGWRRAVVHCRTGSLETDGFNLDAAADVHCRTGSLESLLGCCLAGTGVHCRTGRSNEHHNRCPFVEYKRASPHQLQPRHAAPVAVAVGVVGQSQRLLAILVGAEGVDLRQRLGALRR